MNRLGVGVGMVAAVLLSSCSDDTETMPGPEGVTYSGVITQAGLGNPLAGVEVCAFDPAGECVTTDAEGKYAVPNVPKNTHVEFHVTNPGYVSALGVFDVKDVDRTDVNAGLLDEALAVGIFQDSGITYDPSKGAVLLVLSDPAVEHGSSGYSATITPSAGEGPYYNAALTVLPDGTETTDAGALSFINLPDGEYTVDATGPGECTSDAIVANGPSSWPAVVRAGFISYLVAECPDGAEEVGGSGGAGGVGGAGGAGAN